MSQSELSSISETLGEIQKAIDTVQDRVSELKKVSGDLLTEITKVQECGQRCSVLLEEVIKNDNV